MSGSSPRCLPEAASLVSKRISMSLLAAAAESVATKTVW